MDIQKLATALHPLERKVVPALKSHNTLPEIMEHTGLQEVEVTRALQWLENKEALKIIKEESEIISLGTNGLQYAKEGLPERRLAAELKDQDKSIQELTFVTKEEAGIAIGQLKKSGAIEMKEGKLHLVQEPKESLEEKFIKKTFPINYESLEAQEKVAVGSLRKRKDILDIEKKKSLTVELTDIGKELTCCAIRDDVLERLTPHMLKTGEWKGKTFRPYDVKINVPKISGGKRHFVKEALDYARNIWLDMGFEEMSGDMVQLGFWNFDTLFTPQDHPVREMQDTFFLNTKGTLPDKRIVQEVKEAHEKGVDGSTGWGGNWDAEKASQNVLRTHTTVLSAKTIANLKQEDLPKKFFALGKVFRNEALDWSHLFEFNQTEGIVIDPDATFENLLGYLKQFFKKMGFEKARFRPAYFPYTEPSVEIDVWHPVHNKWLEIGGAGILRPEVVVPLLGKDIPVLAWGPGIDRLILDFHNINDIRELYTNNVDDLRTKKSWVK